MFDFEDVAQQYITDEWQETFAVDDVIYHEDLGSGVIFSRAYAPAGSFCQWWVVAFDDGSFAQIPASELS